MSWNSRTVGAPSLPVASEEEMDLEDLRAALDSGAIDEAMFQAAIARMRSRVASEGAPLAPPAAAGRPGTTGGPYDWEAPLAAADAKWARERRESADRMARGAMPPGPMTGTTEDYQDYAGIQRDPTSRLQDEGRDMAARRRYGARAGGGEAFASDEERAAYGRRNILSQAERNEMARGTMFPVPQAPMTPGQIVDAQRSQADRDMAKSGISGSAGWAPVYVNGKVVYMERAPDDTTLSQPSPPEKRPAPPPPPAPDRRMQTWMHSTLPHSVIGWPEDPAAAPPPPPAEVVPDYSGEPRHELGMTNAAEGNRRTGPRVDAGEFSSSLGGRSDLEDRGYVQKTMQGPYGPERVWVKADVGVKARDRLIADGMPEAEANSMSLAEYQERQRTEGIRRRLMNSAGISSADAAGMSVAQIRELAKDRRAAQKAELSDAARLARMGGRQRNEFALGQMPEDWQNAVMARQFGMGQTTPLDVQAAEAKMAFDMARAMANGADGGSDARMRMMSEQQKIQWMREGRVAIAPIFVPGWRGGASMVARREAATEELRRRGYDEMEIEELLTPYGFSNPEAAPEAAPPNSTGMPAVGPAPPGWPLGRPWPPATPAG